MPAAWNPSPGATTITGAQPGAQPGTQIEPAAPAGPPEYQPTDDELRRWHAPPVVTFRRKMVYYGTVNAMIVLFAAIGQLNLLSVTAFWSVLLAIWYARLWSEGFDWRDVFRQPRHRAFFDVAGEAIDDASALFDQKKRTEMRDRARRRISAGDRTAPPMNASPAFGTPSGAMPAADGGVAALVRQGEIDRTEIIRILESLTPSERVRLPEVVASANALVERMQSLARTASAPRADRITGSAAAIDREIAQLEAEANPLDRDASERRVRRLAFLKRQRRGVVDIDQRQAKARSRLEECAMALQGMRLDVLRLRAGTQSHEHVTSIAEQALVLAREVDIVMHAADEVGRMTSRERQARPDQV